MREPTPTLAPQRRRRIGTSYQTSSATPTDHARVHEALAGAELWQTRPSLSSRVRPVFRALDRRGAGDSMFAAAGVGLSRPLEMIAALCLAWLPSLVAPGDDDS